MGVVRRGLPACRPRAAHVRACFHYFINLDRRRDATPKNRSPMCMCTLVVCIVVTHVSVSQGWDKSACTLLPSRCLVEALMSLARCVHYLFTTAQPSLAQGAPRCTPPNPCSPPPGPPSYSRFAALPVWIADGRAPETDTLTDSLLLPFQSSKQSYDVRPAADASVCTLKFCIILNARTLSFSSTGCFSVARVPESRVRHARTGHNHVTHNHACSWAGPDEPAKISGDVACSGRSPCHR